MFDESGADVVGFHHSFRFVSQQAFAVALKRVPAAVSVPASAMTARGFGELSGAGATGSLGQA
jgi:hypothetical protein